ARDDDGVNDFAEALVGNAGAKRSRNLWVLRQEIVDLERRNLDAAARDDVLAAPDERDGTVRRHPRQVAGLEITAVERGFRQCGAVQITEHAERRADLQFAGFAGRDGA